MLAKNKFQISFLLVRKIPNNDIWEPKFSTPFFQTSNSHMANIHQDGHSIRNIQVVSSNSLHSTRLCEANKCRIFKPLKLFQSIF